MPGWNMLLSEGKHKILIPRNPLMIPGILTLRIILVYRTVYGKTIKSQTPARGTGDTAPKSRSHQASKQQSDILPV